MLTNEISAILIKILLIVLVASLIYLSARYFGNKYKNTSSGADMGRRTGRQNTMKNKIGFSKREKEVVFLLLQGKSNKEMALALGITEGTVEFHLTRIYAKLDVASRVEAIVRINQLGLSLEDFEPIKTRENMSGKVGKYGESPVEKNELSPDNRSERILHVEATSNMPAKTNSFFRKYKMPIIIAMLFLLLIIAAVIYLSRPKSWSKYERECEYPDEFTVGQTIGRSNASGLKVHGQFGTTGGDPWPAVPGSVIYKNINTPDVEQLYMKLRYSKNSPSSVPVLVYIDDEKTPRTSIYLEDQKDWNRFAWTKPIFLGSVESGVHTLTFSTVGQQYGVADLDKFVLTAGKP